MLFFHRPACSTPFLCGSDLATHSTRQPVSSRQQVRRGKSWELGRARRRNVEGAGGKVSPAGLRPSSDACRALRAAGQPLQRTERCRWESSLGDDGAPFTPTRPSELSKGVMRQVEVANEGGNDSLKPSDEARARQGDRSTTGADPTSFGGKAHARQPMRALGGRDACTQQPGRRNLMATSTDDSCVLEVPLPAALTHDDQDATIRCRRGEAREVISASSGYSGTSEA